MDTEIIKPTILQLEKIAEIILDTLKNLSSDQLREMLVMTDYHGFAKARFSDFFVQNVLLPFRLTSQDVQIEVVHVSQDLTHQVHYHEHSDAVVVVMGENEHVDAPLFARSYNGGSWGFIQAHDKIIIPARTPHGFTVDEGGSFYFLSIQSPPIINEIGEDDYQIL